jgi:preprotein translocase subunit SecD
MKRTLYTRLILIIALLVLAIWVDSRPIAQVPNPFNNQIIFSRDVAPRLGLDLRGGLQVILEADLPETTEITAEQMEVARSIIENRTNALGVAENSIQVAGERRLVGEFPGLEDADSVLSTIQQTGLLEFVDFGTTYMEPGTMVTTDYGGNTEVAEGETLYHTIMTGADLNTVGVTTDQFNQTVVSFDLTSEGSAIFAEYTTNHTGEFLGIVLDKQVISAPRVNDPITGGSGLITGNFTIESANALAIQLRYGSLPVPLKVVDTRYIGPTLGEDSLQKSLIAGVIGMLAVIIFMTLFYRLPGIAAVLSILIYGALAFAIFKWIPVTLTLPGIAGFLLSTGSALDANILLFERMKEEIRSGLTLGNALEKGWKRAWSSIRDSNVATLITSAILFWFGNTFGATIVKGFSVTLALGVVISLFTAIVVTRTLLALFIDWFKPTNLKRWFGI